MGGETLRLGRRTPKGVTGYDLTALFVGSEGTFGVTTEITVRLVGRPEGVATFIAVMPDAVSAGRAVSEIIRKGLRPRALELLDSASIDHVRPAGGLQLPRATPARSCWSSSTASREGIEAAVLACGEVCEAEGALDVIVARDDADRERLWKTRRVCSLALREAYQFKLSEDTVVPPARSRRCSGASTRSARATIWRRRRSATPATATCTSTSCRRRPGATPAFAARVDAALAELFKATLDLGGTLSGEHGIGIAKARYMAWEQSAEVIDWQKRLKRLWDPKNLLNPGKIFAE